MRKEMYRITCVFVVAFVLCSSVTAFQDDGSSAVVGNLPLPLSVNTSALVNASPLPNIEEENLPLTLSVNTAELVGVDPLAAAGNATLSQDASILSEMSYEALGQNENLKNGLIYGPTDAQLGALPTEQAVEIAEILFTRLANMTPDDVLRLVTGSKACGQP